MFMLCYITCHVYVMVCKHVMLCYITCYVYVMFVFCYITCYVNVI